MRKGLHVVMVIALAWLACVGMVAVCAAQSTGQRAVSQPDRSGYDGWTFGLGFRSWLTAVSGDVSARGTDATLDVTLDDALHLLDEVQFTLYGHAEVKKGPFGLILDGYYLNLEDQTGLTLALPIHIPPFDRTIVFPVNAKLDTLTETAILEGVLAYDIWTSAGWRGGWPTWRLELLAGARYTYLRSKVDAEFTDALGRTGSLGVDASRDWVDPIVGGRFSWRPGGGLQLGLRSDLGGFTVGSKFTWNVEATVAYQLADWLSVDAGFRALYADYEQGSFKYDVWTYGPWAGLGFKF